MAQHYKVNLKKEIKIQKSVARIGKQIIRDAGTVRRPYEFVRIYGKEVQWLPDEYATESGSTFAVCISPYNLNKKDWGSNSTRVNLECHFNRNGNIVNVYYPL